MGSQLSLNGNSVKLGNNVTAPRCGTENSVNPVPLGKTRLPSRLRRLPSFTGFFLKSPAGYRVLPSFFLEAYDVYLVLPSFATCCLVVLGG